MDVDVVPSLTKDRTWVEEETSDESSPTRSPYFATDVVETPESSTAPTAGTPPQIGWSLSTSTSVCISENGEARESPQNILEANDPSSAGSLTSVSTSAITSNARATQQHVNLCLDNPSPSPPAPSDPEPSPPTLPEPELPLSGIRTFLANIKENVKELLSVKDEDPPPSHLSPLPITPTTDLNTSTDDNVVQSDMKMDVDVGGPSGEVFTNEPVEGYVGDTHGRNQLRGVRKCPWYKRMPGTKFTVDAFCYGRVPGCEAYFLSHFHADHYGGLTSAFSHGPIYCSVVTGNLIVQQLRVKEEYVHRLPLDTPVKIMGVKVVLIEANQ
ncbi:DNA cross-link repair 1A protein [Rhizophlyctis rosea]|uniref:DNA cross-link repair 1A protein n=1 Tax=Rhizophlyctis rosea TaxID=64517 RepID=A0AAD5S8G7_9FUNG|nr:DNA cross-link repair 1A protein [Rhizophlyctis rosea]